MRRCCLPCAHLLTWDFNPRASYGARQGWRLKDNSKAQFQPTRPIRGATCGRPGGGSSTSYFNPRAPYGARQKSGVDIEVSVNFNPRAPYGARPGLPPHVALDDTISTHAPHTGRDCTVSPDTKNLTHFNPRAPYGARRHVAQGPGQLAQVDFNPRAPYGARPDDAEDAEAWAVGFQPTRPIRGATIALRALYWGFKFQPTRPIRGATAGHVRRRFGGSISTHAPHTGRDLHNARNTFFLENFNPRAPYGARRAARQGGIKHVSNFNPRAPYGARLRKVRRIYLTNGFQPTRPIRGATKNGKI